MEFVWLRGVCWVKWSLLGKEEFVGLNGVCWVKRSLFG